MKPSCDEETAYPLTYPFVIYIIRIDQSECSLLSHKRDQPIRGHHFWITIPICGPIITYLWHMCNVLVTNLWHTWLTCNLLVTHLLLYCHTLVTNFWPSYDLIMIHLWHYCYSRWNSFENCVKFSWPKLQKIAISCFPGLTKWELLSLEESKWVLFI